MPTFLMPGNYALYDAHLAGQAYVPGIGMHASYLATPRGVGPFNIIAPSQNYPRPWPVKGEL